MKNFLIELSSAIIAVGIARFIRWHRKQKLEREASRDSRWMGLARDRLLADEAKADDWKWEG